MRAVNIGRFACNSNNMCWHKWILCVEAMNWDYKYLSAEGFLQEAFERAKYIFPRDLDM